METKSFAVQTYQFSMFLMWLFSVDFNVKLKFSMNIADNQPFF